MQFFYACYALSSISWLAFFLTGENLMEFNKIAAWKPAALLFLISIIVRLPFLTTTPQLSIDTYWYGDYMQFIRNGASFYRDFFFPYPQGFAVLIHALSAFPSGEYLLRVITGIVDAATACVIFFAAQASSTKRGIDSQALQLGLLYAFCPIAIIESAWNGHFESLVCFGAAAIIYTLRKNSSLMPGLLIGCSFVIKIFPVVLFPLLFVHRSLKSRLLAIGGFMIAVGCFTAPFLPVITPLAMYWKDLLLPPIQPSHGNSLPYAAQSLSAVAQLLPASTGITHIAKFAVPILLLLTLAASLKTQFQRCLLLSEALMAFFALDIALGQIVIPWSDLAYTYPWWTPSTITIVRGIAIAFFILFAALNFKRNNIESSLSSELIVACSSVLFVLIVSRPVVNGWYYLPIIPMLLLADKTRQSFGFLAAMLALGITYTSSSFSTVSQQVVRPITWHTEISAITPQETQVTLSAPGSTSFAIPPGETTLIASLDRTSRIAQEYSAVRFIGTANVKLDSTTALAFQETINDNPTFGGAKSAFSVYIDGIDHTGQLRKNVLAIADNSFATNHAATQFRIPLLNVSKTLSTIQQIAIEVHAIRPSPPNYIDTFNNINFIDEPRITAATIPCLIVFIGLFTLICIQAQKRLPR